MHKYKTHVKNKAALKTGRPSELIIRDLLIQIFYASEKTHFLIAVGGPGGTGKSSFCKVLSNALADSTILKLDDYKTNRKIRAKQNLFGPHPDANKTKLIYKHLELISQGQSFQKPVYDTDTGTGDGFKDFRPAKYNIIDGEIATYKQFRELIDFAIFIDSDWKTQLNTRISRDIQELNYTKDKAISTFLQSNLREFSKYGAESKNWADVHIYCHDDYQLTIEAIAQNIYHHFESLFKTTLTAVELAGLIVAVPTPFTEAGRIEPEYLIKHLEFLHKNGIKRILINGTTGEFFSLTHREQKHIFSLARRYFPGLVIFHAGNCSRTQTLTDLKMAEDLGADAILISVPFYYAHAPEKGITQYLKDVCKAASIPIILYNFPKHTQNQLTPDILSELEHFGIKDSAGNLDLIKNTPNYYSADDSLIYTAYKVGAKGFISGHANHSPQLFVSLEQAMADGNTKIAAKLQKEINQLLDTLSTKQIRYESNIAKFKYLISKHIPGYSDKVRLPLLDLKTGSKKIIDSVLTLGVSR